MKMEQLFDKDNQFYPTPISLAEKMLQGVDLRHISTVLEPSAGKGDLLKALAKTESHSYDVDCIELDPNLRAILKYNFSDERRREISARISEIKESERNGGANLERAMLEECKNCMFEKGIHIVCDDFLNYNPFKRYDLILMNPPFQNGDVHLLKALDIQKHGGAVICVLNANTIRNPFTDSRKALVKKLNEYNAQYEYITDAFSNAERKTNVEVVIVKVDIPRAAEESEIYERMSKAEKLDEFTNKDITELEVTDYVKAVVTRFNVEVRAGIELIRQYEALSPYIPRGFKDDSYDKNPILELKIYGEKFESGINAFVKKVRMKYWQELLANDKFMGKLTSRLRKMYQSKVEKLIDYDFSEFNIGVLTEEMNASIKKGIENEIGDMFDKLTEEHSWYPETQKNRHYYNGWATNKAHKIDKKVIIPCYGVFNSWDGRPEVYNAHGFIGDIEKVLAYFAGNINYEPNVYNIIDRSFKRGETKNIEFPFFKATFYKKGTVHLEFTCPDLIKRFNIYAAQKRGWLPPCYGKKKYVDMGASEKDVIDSFQGAEDYEQTLENSSYFLASPVRNTLLELT